MCVINNNNKEIFLMCEPLTRKQILASCKKFIHIETPLAKDYSNNDYKQFKSHTGRAGWGMVGGRGAGVRMVGGGGGQQTVSKSVA